MTYRRATWREGENVEGPPGVFLWASCIRLEGSSARRDVCPQQPPITSIVFLGKAFFYLSSSSEREGHPISPPTRLQLHFHVPRFEQADPFVVKNTAGEKNFSLIGARPAAFYFHEHLFCVASGEWYLKVWRESSLAAGLIWTQIRTAGFVRDEGARAAGKRIKGWICKADYSDRRTSISNWKRICFCFVTLESFHWPL